LKRGTFSALIDFTENPIWLYIPSKIPLLLGAALQIESILTDESPFISDHLHVLRTKLASVPWFIGTEEAKESAVRIIPSLLKQIRYTYEQTTDFITRYTALLYGTLEVCRAIQITDEELELWKSDPSRKLYYAHAAAFHYWVNEHNNVTFEQISKLISNAPNFGRLLHEMYPSLE